MARCVLRFAPKRQIGPVPRDSSHHNPLLGSCNRVFYVKITHWVGY